jgi:hypothetical protein
VAGEKPLDSPPVITCGAGQLFFAHSLWPSEPKLQWRSLQASFLT